MLKSALWYIFHLAVQLDILKSSWPDWSMILPQHTLFLQSDLLPRKRNIFPRRYSQQIQENKECHNLLTLASDTFILVTACCIQENGLKRESPCLTKENSSFRAQREAARLRRMQSTFCPWCPILYRKIQAQPVKNSMMGPVRKSSPQKGGRSTSTTRNRLL